MEQSPAGTERLTQPLWCIGVLGCPNGFEARSLAGNMFVQVGTGEWTAHRPTASDRDAWVIDAYSEVSEILEPFSLIQRHLKPDIALGFLSLRRCQLRGRFLNAIVSYRYASEIGSRRAGSYQGYFFISESPTFRERAVMEIGLAIERQTLNQIATSSGVPQFRATLTKLIAQGNYADALLGVNPIHDLELHWFRIGDLPVAQLWLAGRTALTYFDEPTPEVVRNCLRLDIPFSSVSLAMGEDRLRQRVMGTALCSQEETLRFADLLSPIPVPTPGPVPLAAARSAPVKTLPSERLNPVKSPDIVSIPGTPLQSDSYDGSTRRQSVPLSPTPISGRDREDALDVVTIMHDTILRELWAERDKAKGLQQQIDDLQRQLNNRQSAVPPSGKTTVAAVIANHGTGSFGRRRLTFLAGIFISGMVIGGASTWLWGNTSGWLIGLLGSSTQPADERSQGESAPSPTVLSVASQARIDPAAKNHAIDEKQCLSVVQSFVKIESGEGGNWTRGQLSSRLVKSCYPDVSRDCEEVKKNAIESSLDTSINGELFPQRVLIPTGCVEKLADSASQQGRLSLDSSVAALPARWAGELTRKGNLITMTGNSYATFLNAINAGKSAIGVTFHWSLTLPDPCQTCDVTIPAAMQEIEQQIRKSGLQEKFRQESPERQKGAQKLGWTIELRR